MSDELLYTSVLPPLGPFAKYPYTNKNMDIIYNTERKLMNFTSSNFITMNVNYTIESPKTVHLTAAGLRHSDIEIKEVDSKLHINTKSGLKGFYTTICAVYDLKNVKLHSSTLSLGVLTLEFVDTDNVVRHTVKEA